MVEETAIQLGICIVPTFIFNFILLGFDVYSGIITLVTILMIVVDTAGLCSLWGVDLNAVSLINLVAVSCLLRIAYYLIATVLSLFCKYYI